MHRQMADGVHRHGHGSCGVQPVERDPGLLDLPDDVLLLVLESVDVRGLWRCRLTCRLLWHLCATTDVWRRRRFSDADSLRDMKTAMRLAPRVTALTVSSSKALTAFPLTLVTTRCAASELTLEMFDRNKGLVVLGAIVAWRQAQLGRLRRLDVALCLPQAVRWRPALQFLETVYGVARTAPLQELAIAYEGLAYSLRPASAKAPLWLPPSSLPGLEPLFLKKLTYVSQQDDRMLWSLLERSAASLCDVQLLCVEWCRPEVLQLLGAMPRLRSVAVPVVQGLQALRQCRGVTHLVLHVTPAVDRNALAAAELLLRDAAPRLTSVEILYGFRRAAEGQASPDEARLVEALALRPVSHPAAATLLRVFVGHANQKHYTDNNLAPPPLAPLLAALPHLRHLRHLSLDFCLSDAFLEALAAGACPGLKRLDAGIAAACNNRDLIHGQSALLRELLNLQRGLHVVYAWFGTCHCFVALDEPCEHCTAGCCAERLSREISLVGLRSAAFHGGGVAQALVPCDVCRDCEESGEVFSWYDIVE